MADTRIEAGTPECAVSALRTEPFRFRWYPVNGAIMSLIALALWKNSYKKTEPEHQNRRLKIACEVSDKTERSWDNNKGQVIINTSLPLNCPSEILSVYQGETVPNAGRLSSECSLRNKWCCVCRQGITRNGKQSIEGSLPTGTPRRVHWCRRFDHPLVFFRDVAYLAGAFFGAGMPRYDVRNVGMNALYAAQLGQPRAFIWH